MTRTYLLFLNVLIVATCGLVYELLAGTLASYVLGDSVTQFSLIIGIYLFAMGVGSWLSGFLENNLARRFVEVELAVALIGGFSAPLLFLGFAKLTYFRLLLYSVVFLIGVLVGLEIPLLMRILKDQLDFKDLVSRVLAFDYLGALAASLLFPIFCVPRLGLMRTSLVFGLLNAAVGLWGTYLLQPLITGRVAGLRLRAVAVIATLIVGIIKADSIIALAEETLFVDTVVYARETAYQRIVVTRNAAGFQLFLNGNLQFSSVDEYRYHESLVHPAMIAADKPKRVLVLGGGDGLALREVLKHPSVESVTLVDIDPEMTSLSENFPLLAELNGHAFADPRVHVVHEDAFLWIEKGVRSRSGGEPDGAKGPAITSRLPSAHSAPPRHDFDVILIDFPDPNNFALGKLYTRRFYRMVHARLAEHGALGVQCTSPLFARTSYWCIVRTMESAGLVVRPYQAAVPSFGVWGFTLARKSAFAIPAHAPPGLQFLDDAQLHALFAIPLDAAPVPVEINRLDNQVLVRYYESEWRKFETH